MMRKTSRGCKRISARSEILTSQEFPPLSTMEGTLSHTNEVLTVETTNPPSSTSEETRSHDESTIEGRRRRLALVPEPGDGVHIQVKYGDGSSRRRRFCLKQSIQVLFDFAGSDDMATDVFHVQMANSSTVTPSTASGTLSELGLTAPTTVYALWLGSQEVQERLSQNALEAHPTHSTIHREESPADTEYNIAPCRSQDNLLHKHKELPAPPGGAVTDAVEGSVVALSWPWFIPIEERPSQAPPTPPLPL
ncbi:hypothetical protein AAFF_G00280490 [Aldrovandia affinis]|uniref:UBX domain-containing protein n=1 Tax=Aldrovandia affinis TaxID=143900 RepID=A0AAD7W1X4_9TELE|nr:hypothetical protein AAFF_G00280490 [Aldrovandia affinis]